MASYHPALYNSSSEIGNGVFTSENLPSGTRLVSCAYSDAITSPACRDLIDALSITHDRLSDRQVMAAVLVLLLSVPFRKNLPDQRLTRCWTAYVDSLPQHVLTPLEFSAEERALLENTNLHGALVERENEWQSSLEAVKASTSLDISWAVWLLANSIISSRAFPSSLIDNDEANATPVLFPAVDSLNHNPSSKVLWLKESDRLTLVTEQDIPANTQCYNNYGPKSNEELLLGYGFVIPNNPADLLAVKLGRPRIPPSSTRTLTDPTELFQHLGIDTERLIISRDGKLPDTLLAQMRFYLADEEEQAGIAEKARASKDVQVLGFVSWENELTMLDQLGSMLEMKARGLEKEVGLVNEGSGTVKRARMDNGVAQIQEEPIRPEVRRMIEIYRQGTFLPSCLCECED